MAEHTSKQFDAELERVRSRVLQMGGMVEEQITRAMESLISGDMELIDKVIGEDHRVNAIEVELDEACSHIIARRQPAAGDLRLLVAVIKTITDLERIGDEAQKIARMAKLIHTADRQHMPRLDLSHVADRATAMPPQLGAEWHPQRLDVCPAQGQGSPRALGLPGAERRPSGWALRA